MVFKTLYMPPNSSLFIIQNCVPVHQHYVTDTRHVQHSYVSPSCLHTIPQTQSDNRLSQLQFQETKEQILQDSDATIITVTTATASALPLMLLL
jgi:hypothetical protein